MQEFPFLKKIVPGVRKIAVLRANSLGDFLFALPALQALRNTYPGAEIVLLAKEWHKKFIEGRPGPVNRVVVVPRCNGIPHETDRIADPEEVRHFFTRMKDEQFDIALQMHGGGRNSNPFVKSLGAKLTVGHRTPDAEPLDINIHYYLYQHEVLRYLETVSEVGAHTSDLDPRITVTENDRAELRKSVGELKKPFAVLHPGASEIQRRWSPERFAAIGDLLAANGFHVYVTGTAPEKKAVERTISSMKHDAESLCDKLSVNALVAFLTEAEILVSNDTGPLHLAKAVNTPTAGIYWCGNAITAGLIKAKNNRVSVSWRQHCPLCGADCTTEDVHHPAGECRHEVSFVDDISAEEVAGNVKSLLSHSLKAVAG